MSPRATDSELIKAFIQVLDENDSVEDIIPARFNPSEYNLSKQIDYGDQPIAGMTSPMTQFVSGQAETLSMELLFDTHEQGADVRRHTDRLDDLVEIHSELHAPPRCRFVWGSLVFTAVVESLDKQFTMFRPGGFPTRARVDITFREYITPEEQLAAIPRHSADKATTHRVTSGDTLSAIAAAEYDDPSKWRPIAEHNEIVHPRELKPGTVLEIPPL